MGVFLRVVNAVGVGFSHGIPVGTQVFGELSVDILKSFQELQCASGRVEVDLSSAGCILTQSLVQVGVHGHEDNNQARLLVLVGAVDAGDGLHQVVFLLQAVHVHGVQYGRVEAGEQAVGHDNDFQRILGILDAALHLAGCCPVAAERGEFFRVAGGA